MRTVHRSFGPAVPVLAVALAVSPLFAAKPTAKKGGDLIWTHPAFDSLGIKSIALLPVTSFDHNRENERKVENLFAQALRPSGYRWVTPAGARELIKVAHGESTLARVDADILKNGRIDSLRAGALCKATRANAIMSMRLDLFEQALVEWNQSGTPSTTVKLRAALVDSAGRLLWSASGSETGEGTPHDPNAATMGVKSSGLGTTPITAQGGAPSYDEVTTRLVARWMAHFPAMKPATPAQP